MNASVTIEEPVSTTQAQPCVFLLTGGLDGKVWSPALPSRYAGKRAIYLTRYARWGNQLLRQNKC